MAAPITDSLGVANLALSELGQEPILSPLTIATTTDKRCRVCNANYEPIRDEVLRSHAWNCATKRVSLGPTEKTITGATAANPVVLTSTSHGLAAGTYIIVTGVVGMTQLNGQRLKLASVTTHTMTLADPNGTALDGSAYTAYSSGGTATVAPAWGFTHAYALPSDYLRMAYPELLGEQFRIEGAYIHSNETSLNIAYIYRLTDVSLMDQLLVSAIAARLAAAIAKPLTGSDSDKNRMEALYQQRLNEARYTDCTDGPLDTMESFSWVNARVGGSNYLVPENAD